MIYTDIISKDVLLSTNYEHYEFFDIAKDDGVILEVDCARVSYDGQYDDEKDLEVDYTDPEDPTIINIVQTFNLKQISIEKKFFPIYIKLYVQNIKRYLAKYSPSQVEEFQKGAKAHVKKIMDSYDDWKLYTGESGNRDAMIVYMGYREDGTTPFVVFWKHGFLETTGENA